MATLWDKGVPVDEAVKGFTVGQDYILDHELIPADVAGSMAHARMLAKIGILKVDELVKIMTALKEILALDKQGRFEIKSEDEDVHTAVENYLTAKLGDLGKKIHTARSRNDQVLTDLRMYSKEKLLSIEDSVLALAEALLKLADAGKDTPIPGRTHTQLAMPSSVGLWAGAFAESLLDDLELLKSAYSLTDQCPLGSAASYGVSLSIDRKLVADLLGFAKVQNNVLYANNSRGKVEAAILSALSQVMADLSKMATDMILFSIPELGYFELPEKFCTGSSMMPNKKNPDVLELVRAKANKVLAAHAQVINTIKDLPSGYNRDFQETKAPLMEGFAIAKSSLEMMALVVSNLKVNKEKCVKACVPEIFATDKAVSMAAKGMPFRDAYQAVAQNLDQLKIEDPVANIKSKKHLGATGNLGLEKDIANVKAEKAEIFKKQKVAEDKLAKLMKP